MSIEIGKKIRQIREAEGLTRDEFFALTDIPSSTQKFYETGRTASVGSEILFKITQHERFDKYTLWLMTGKTAPAAGQISPALSPDGLEENFNSRRSQKVG